MEDKYAVRYKDGRLSTTGNAEDIFSGLQKLLPVDKIFRVVPHADGKGYELREVGHITVDFVPSDNQPITPRPQVEAPQVPPQPSQPSFPLTNKGVSEIGLEPNPVDASGYRFDTDTPPAKSQEQLAVELNTPEGAVITKKAVEAKKKKPGRKAKTAPKSDTSDQCSDDPNDKSWLKGAPPPVRVSSPGRASVTHVRTATPEEAAAASQFGKGF